MQISFCNIQYTDGVAKQLSARHLVFATHNSRYSQRMLDNGMEQELVITEIITDIVLKNASLLRVINYNICVDHIHLLVICDEVDIPKIVQAIKGTSAKLFNDKYNQRGVQIWAQKYSDTFVKNDRHLEEMVRYISDNRYKHGLPESKGLKPLVAKMCGEFYLDYNKGFEPLIDETYDAFCHDYGKGSKIDDETVVAEMRDGFHPDYHKGLKPLATKKIDDI